MARIYLRGKEEAVREYEKGVQGLDLPTWKREQVEDMVTRYRMISDELSEVRRKAVIEIRKRVGTRAVPNYLRPILRAWKLVKLGVPAREYQDEVRRLAEKNGVDIRILNEILRALGLPEVR